MIALFIFKQPQDDGSELLICSKPLTHKKVIASKFIVFVITSLLFALGSSLITCFAFCMNNVNYWTVLSLILSLFVVNFIFTLLYGGIAIILSIRHGKIGMIAGNMVVALLSVIYSTVANVALQEPSTLITNSKTMASSNGAFINYQNKQTKFEYIVPLSGDITDMITKANIDWEKGAFYDAVKSSLTGKMAPLNMSLHMYMMSNLWHLNDIRKQINGMSELGATTAYNYTIKGLLHSVPTQSAPAEYTDDQYTKWSDFGKPESPMFYTQYSNLKIEDMRYLARSNSLTEAPDFDKLLVILQNALTAQNVVMPCGISESASIIATTSTLNGPFNDTRLLFRYDDPWSLDPTYTVGKFYKGTSNYRNFLYYNPKLIELTPLEKDVFDYIVYESMFDINSDIYKNCFIRDDTYYKINLVSENQNYLYNKYVYNILNLDSVKTALKLNSDFDYALAFYKYKYYLSRQLLGQYGIYNDVCTNWNDPTADKITVPYENYFRLVFIPQYNSYYVRNIDGYKESLKDLFPDYDINPKDVFRYGSFALPRLINNSTQVDLMSYILDNSESPTWTSTLMKASSVEYDGTQVDLSKVENKELYQIYNVHEGDWTVVNNHYGYFSELGLKIDSLLQHFAFQKSPIYVNGDYTNLYSPQIESSNMLGLVFNRLAFTYDCTDAYSPYMLLVVYLIIDALILAGTYFKYIRYDFK